MLTIYLSSEYIFTQWYSSNRAVCLRLQRLLTTKYLSLTAHDIAQRHTLVEAFANSVELRSALRDEVLAGMRVDAHSRTAMWRAWRA